MADSAAPAGHILIVDDDAFVRDGLRLYLESQGFQVREAGDETTARAAITAAPPEAALIDISIPPDPQAPRWANTDFGLRLTRWIKDQHPAIGVILLSAYEYYLDEVWSLLTAGVRGLAYRLKGRRASLLLETLRQVLNGHVEIDPEVQARRPRLADELSHLLTPDERPWVERAVQGFASLTPQEARAAHLLAASHNTHGIAQRLALQRADTLISRVYDKLGLAALAEQAPHLRQIAILIKACQLHDLRQAAS